MDEPPSPKPVLPVHLAEPRGPRAVPDRRGPADATNVMENLLEGPDGELIGVLHWASSKAPSISPQTMPRDQKGQVPAETQSPDQDHRRLQRLVAVAVGVSESHRSDEQDRQPTAKSLQAHDVKAKPSAEEHGQ
eukprot:8345954-Pyramimonas_sp.AAC.1